MKLVEGQFHTESEEEMTGNEPDDWMTVSVTASDIMWTPVMSTSEAIQVLNYFKAIIYF